MEQGVGWKFRNSEAGQLGGGCLARKWMFEEIEKIFNKKQSKYREKTP
jgi:hypothetical protein